MPKKRVDYPDQVVVRLTDADRKRLEALAAVSGLTPSSLVRALVRTARITPPTVVFQHDGGAAEVSETHGAAIPA